MDLNELFFRHQIALMRLADARTGPERECHEAEVDRFARRIATVQRNCGARGAKSMQERYL